MNAFALRTTIDLDAAPPKVWAVLTDAAAYPEWNPLILSLTGELTVGATVTTRVRDAEGKERTFKPKVLVADPDRELTWLSRIAFGGLFDGEHSYRLEELPGGRTRLRNDEEFRGISVPFLRSMLRRTIEPQFEAMNHALAARLNE
ncbi:SRPBCC domain-containing protein [Kribbella sp. NBC_01505]|uniref:SRPBCC family protein n=1 Tax=Kribbella sp. NBC_01505 TaxID=2903580 RepID=UPI00386F8035